MRTLWFAAVVGCAVPWPQTATAAPVRVEGGLVEGVAEGDLTVYQGVPFAAPPVGALRWRAPQPAAEWSGVLEADQFAPGCVPSMGDPPPSGASEDCLYLNVWTPAKSPGDGLPVLVWIYGGGFNAGATSIPVHDGAKLARRGVVLVSIAYRVGILGFHAQRELSAESPRHVSGNYGLLDMLAALRWIQRNIAAFGGDPKRVTIFGESAGGIAVSMLCASPLAKGLFHGAISQSGGSFGPSSRSPVPGENMRLLADAEASGAGLAEAAGARSLEELRALSAEKVVEAGRRLPGMAWPIIDGWVIPGDQYELYEAGRFNDTPILVGYNSDEGLSFTRARTPEEYVAGVRRRYGPFADRLLEAYPTAADAIPKTARDLARDSAFGWHTWVWARLQSARGRGKAYLYYFDQHPEHPAGSPEAGHGSPHGADVAYVLENLDGLDRPVTADDRRISEAMAAYWTDFAKRGDPNGDGMPTWPAFSDGHPVVMYFAGTPHTGPVPSEGSLRVLDRYFAWRRTPEGAGETGIGAYYGLSKDVVEAAGGRVGRSHERREDFDVVIGGGGGMTTAPEWSIWTDISQKLDLNFIELPDDLLAELAREGEQERGTIPAGLYRGIVRPIPTVVRTGTVVYGRDDMPDDFAYDVAKALDEQQQLLQWRHLNFSYNVHTVWRAYEVPLHPGAARYYREKGYME
jgi:para-nitrobenzyl esterase